MSLFDVEASILKVTSKIEALAELSVQQRNVADTYLAAILSEIKKLEIINSAMLVELQKIAVAVVPIPITSMKMNFGAPHQKGNQKGKGI